MKRKHSEAARAKRRLQDAYEQEQVRSRIAADMHDVVAHSWAVVAAQADGARYSLRTSPDRAEQALEVIGETARGAITDLRRILTQLRHAESDEGTIGPEQQQVVLDRMRASGMDLRFTETGERPTSSLLTLTAHRLLAESLTNALKHGDLSRPVTAILLWDKGFTLDIRNAIGATPGSGTGHGILGMTERADLAGGQVTSRRECDQWVVRATVPEPGQQAGQQAGQETQRPQQQEQA
jgi:signal transduction histidine kinase